LLLWGPWHIVLIPQVVHFLVLPGTLAILLYDFRFNLLNEEILPEPDQPLLHVLVKTNHLRQVLDVFFLVLSLIEDVELVQQVYHGIQVLLLLHSTQIQIGSFVLIGHYLPHSPHVILLHHLLQVSEG